MTDQPNERGVIEAVARALMTSCHTFPEQAKDYVSFGQARHMAQAVLNALADNLPDDAVNGFRFGLRVEHDTLANGLTDDEIRAALKAALQHVRSKNDAR